MGHLGAPRRRPGRADPEATRQRLRRSRDEEWRRDVAGRLRSLCESADRRRSTNGLGATGVPFTLSEGTLLQRRGRRRRSLLGAAIVSAMTLCQGKEETAVQYESPSHLLPGFQNCFFLPRAGGRRQNNSLYLLAPLVWRKDFVNQCAHRTCTLSRSPDPERLPPNRRTGQRGEP